MGNVNHILRAIYARKPDISCQYPGLTEEEGERSFTHSFQPKLFDLDLLAKA